MVAVATETRSNSRIPPSAATLPGFSDIMQVAVIARDASAVVERLGKALAAGSFKCATLKPPALFGTTYAGGPGDGSMKVGITWIGDMLIEVIEPLAAPNVYADYLRDRGGKAGVQHIFLQHKGITYDAAIARFAAAGYAPKQHGRLNADGRLGFLTLPALPESMAERHATRFCYTSTRSTLKLDVELAQFAFGVSYRAGLAIAAAQEWSPPTGPRYFEKSPPNAFLRGIDRIYVFGRDLGALARAYGKLADHALDIVAFDDNQLPGAGRMALIQCGATQLVLVEPRKGPLLELMEANGEGVNMLGGIARDRKTVKRMRDLGWTASETQRGVYALHEDAPFALWVRSNGR